MIGEKVVSVNTYSLRYSFNQRFNAPAKQAFDWCTDYTPQDLSLMKESGERRIRRLTGDTIILTETTQSKGQSIKKTKVVRLNPDQLSWTSTHLSGPYKHSQFLYRIVAERKSESRLYFTGLILRYSSRRLNKHQLRRIAESERRADSRAWKHLAVAMGKDFSLNR